MTTYKETGVIVDGKKQLLYLPEITWQRNINGVTHHKASLTKEMMSDIIRACRFLHKDFQSTEHRAPSPGFKVKDAAIPLLVAHIYMMDQKQIIPAEAIASWFLEAQRINGKEDDLEEEEHHVDESKPKKEIDTTEEIDWIPAG